MSLAISALQAVAETNSADALAAKIKTRTAKMGIVGLGYVGLPLAVEFAKAGFSVTGIDVADAKVTTTNSGRSCVRDVSDLIVAEQVEQGRLQATGDFSVLQDLDTVNICVPTPLRKTKDPDMSCVVMACQEVARYLRAGMLIILESTTYPGTTDELLLPMFEASGLTVGKDFFLCFSPERIDPGNTRHTTFNIPKIVGGVTPECTRLAALLYSHAVEQVVPVSSTKVAEMTKLLENTFRMINIGLVNELALLCDRMDINIWEVIDAAATKPFGFMPFYPGPGLGGHCIPVDPFYLSWKSKQAGIEARFIELAGYINSQMPAFVVDKVQAALNDQSKPLKSSHIHIVGVSYKPNVEDMRESPALDIIHLLLKRGAKVTYTDPFVPRLEVDGEEFSSEQIHLSAALADCTLIVTNHLCFDYGQLLSDARLIVDTRNALRGVESPRVIRL